MYWMMEAQKYEKYLNFRKFPTVELKKLTSTKLLETESFGVNKTEPIYQ